MIAVKNKEKKNITHLNTYSINKTLENIRQYKRDKFVRVRTSAIIFAGIVLIGFASIPLVRNLQAADNFNHVHAQAMTKLEDLEENRESLEYKVGLLEDEEYIAKLARQELNVAKPNEILINIPEKEETKSNKENDDIEKDHEELSETDN